MIRRGHPALDAGSNQDPRFRGDGIPQAVKILKQGGVVVYPTDTAYGLAADATNAAAVKKLYKLKGRDFRKPVHVICPNTNWIKKIVKLNKQALLLMNEFLPGPLTVVLPLKVKGDSWKILSANTQTMGIRLPDNKIALGLVKLFNRPITTTSANISDLPTCYSVAEVKKQFADLALKPDFYLDGGKLKKGSLSTIILLTDKGAKIIRPGKISEKQIQKCISLIP